MCLTFSISQRVTVKRETRLLETRKGKGKKRKKPFNQNLENNDHQKKNPRGYSVVSASIVCVPFCIIIILLYYDTDFFFSSFPIMILGRIHLISFTFTARLSCTLYDFSCGGDWELKINFSFISRSISFLPFWKAGRGDIVCHIHSLFH